ncbi:hypothetical protein MTR_4g111870 [Medicago truncatula]|uniref:Uncharacterized protein n=1 Tax=Medicago truncatula TaxID=3880 RepID=G7JRZ1_MEDTR|nr:hypothetical protein MTR_4g111870 [Medicago truncatula]
MLRSAWCIVISSGAFLHRCKDSAYATPKHREQPILILTLHRYQKNESYFQSSYI